MKDDFQNYEHSVFINCPFDLDYAPLLRSMMFAVVDCGFVRRTALDVSDASEVRIQKIYNIIGACRLSIHDLSRTHHHEPASFQHAVGARNIPGRQISWGFVTTSKG